MLRVECPHCSKRLTAPAEYSGKQVSCQKCNGKFILPDLKADIETPPSKPVEVTAPPSIAPAEPSSPPLQSSTAFGSISEAETQRQRSKRGLDTSMVEARNWTALFDFRFRKFLSPKILRFGWVVFLVMIALWFCAATFALVLGTMAALSTASTGDAPQMTLNAATNGGTSTALDPNAVSAATAQFGGGLSGPLSQPAPRAAGLVGFLFVGGTYLASVFGMFLALCYGRVLFESIHIFFNIADSLKSIDSKFDAR